VGVLPLSHGSIGETKLKILAIIHNNGASHGYSIWTTLKKRFNCYLDDLSLRNVYHHLHDLKKLGLVERSLSQTNKNAPKKHLYKLTDKGKTLEERFRKYMDIL
jgi:DNA-binding PadR family transcriptional regulator